MTSKPPGADVRPLQRDGAGQCGCQRPDLGHQRGCLWSLDRRPGRGPKPTLTERVQMLERALALLEARLAAVEVRPDAAAGGDAG
jgi:hypothetical protein